MRNKVLGWTRDKHGNIVNWHEVSVANTITANKRDNTQNYIQEENGRVSKLTPRECFRLMGVQDCDIDKIISAGISDTQLFKLAGNSIVVNTLASVFYNLFIKK